MKSRDFCYWLQGFFELSSKDGDKSLTGEQTLCIEKHLALVFKHEIDPEMGDESHQKALNEIHVDGSNVKMRC